MTLSEVHAKHRNMVMNQCDEAAMWERIADSYDTIIATMLTAMKNHCIICQSSLTNHGSNCVLR